MALLCFFCLLKAVPRRWTGILATSITAGNSCSARHSLCGKPANPAHSQTPKAKQNHSTSPYWAIFFIGSRNDLCNSFSRWQPEEWEIVGNDCLWAVVPWGWGWGRATFPSHWQMLPHGGTKETSGHKAQLKKKKKKFIFLRGGKGFNTNLSP